MNKRPCKKARLCSTSGEEEADLPPGGSLWDLLSSLPDLVLAHLLSFFLPPSHGLRVLPNHRRRLYHAAKAFLERGDDPATPCPESFWHDDTDQYGHHTLAPRIDAAVLALRATCRALRDRVDLVLRLPPLSFVDQLHAWLREQVGPAAPAIGDIEAARRLTQQASALTGRAHALLHQLRLEEVVEEVCREWKIGRAKRRALARLTRPEEEGEEAGQQPRLRVVHLAHRSDLVGGVGCQAIDASLTLSLPGLPHELVEIGLVSELTYETDLTVLLALHTRSTEWCRRLGLSTAQPPPPQPLDASGHHPAAAAAHDADGGEQSTTRALIGWSQGEARLHTALLAKLWAALGFACRPGLVGDDPMTIEKNDDDDEVWGGHEVAAVLLGCLGFMSRADVLDANPFKAGGAVDEDAEDDEARELADAECVERTTARFNERRSVEPLLRGWNQFLRGHVAQPAGLGRRQALVAWELVARTVERYVGQLRVSHIGHALEVLHGLSPVGRIDQPVAHIPPQVLDSVRVLGCQSFTVRGPGGSGEEPRHTHTCARFALRPLPSPPASSAADLVLFRCELSSCEDERGVAAQLLLITAQACAPGGDNAVQVLVKCVPFLPYNPHGNGPLVTVATQKLVQVGRALGMTPNNTKAKKKENESEDEDDENESESEDLDAGLEDEGAREEAEFARQVASALMFVAQLVAWNGCERFEGDDEEEELTNDEFNLDDTIGRAPLARLCFTGRTWAYW